MDLAVLCVSYVELKKVPTDAIWLFSVTQRINPPLQGSPPPTPSTLVGILVVLA